MYKWYLPTLSEVIALSGTVQGRRVGSPTQQQVRAEREWYGAIAALNVLLQQLQHSPQDSGSQDSGSQNSDSQIQTLRGIVLSGPAPVLEQPDLVAQFSSWTFAADPLRTSAWMPLQLLPAANQQAIVPDLSMATLPLLPEDPLSAEQFCLVLTPTFGLVMVLGEGLDGEPAFLFSFAPDVVWQAWQCLRSRLMLNGSQFLKTLNDLMQQFAPAAPAYETVMQFSQLMLAYLPDPYEWEDDCDGRIKEKIRHDIPAPIAPLNVPLGDVMRHVTHEHPTVSTIAWHEATTETVVALQDEINRNQERLDRLTQVKASPDAELLQAIAHEVRTPLATIRTLTRLLLKRKDLSPDVVKRLQLIDQECTVQIDRFNLIFRAVELETAAVKSPLSPLAAISLGQVFQQNVPRWQEQAKQRDLTLEVVVPQKLPMVVVDPTMLEQVLTGLIDRITHSLPPGSHIQVRVKLAGHQLKLQFQSQPRCSGNSDSAGAKNQPFTPTLKSLGQLLMFQPETGSLSLNLSVTKNLFQALGGKLIVRQKPQQGEVLTIFLPLETRGKE
ncbi:MAG: HAMP domain-containing sensor histidine kinase [Oculatellaceae cyanobacterium bins.114]|nr:HAMP domain-containing sensor histidine kinase [Oculatellaceae cyanobacterium bins.114]